MCCSPSSLTAHLSLNKNETVVVVQAPNAWGLRAMTTCWPTCGRCCQRDGVGRALVEGDLSADLPASAVALGLLGPSCASPLPPTTMLLLLPSTRPQQVPRHSSLWWGGALTRHNSLRLTHHSPLWMGTSTVTGSTIAIQITPSCRQHWAKRTLGQVEGDKQGIEGWMVMEGDLTWRGEHHVTHNVCRMHTWNLHHFTNQCQPNQFN